MFTFKRRFLINQSSSVQRTYKLEFYRLDHQFVKIIMNDMNPKLVYEDYGLFSHDYQLDSINFNLSQQVISY